MKQQMITFLKSFSGKLIVLLTIIVLSGGSLFGQSLYTMQNALVSDCEGFLEDSNNGPEEGQYDHNEDYIFTICIENATEIVLLFEYFSSELNFDVLTIYDGPDLSSPQIAQLSGIVQPAPSLIAYSGCVTFHFVSDENIAAKGWRLRWTSRIESLPSPQLFLLGETQCTLDYLQIYFPDSIDCTLLQSQHFLILGPENVAIQTIEIIDCHPVTNKATLANIIFSHGISEPGLYKIFFSAQTQDICGDPLTIDAEATFLLSPCPITLQVNGPSSLCLGECGIWEAEVNNGSGQFQYFWSHGTGQSSVELCLDTSTLVELIVFDVVNNLADTTEFFVVVEICPLKATVSALIPSCPGNCGSASLELSGGSGDLSIDWSHNQATSTSTTICLDSTQNIIVVIVDNEAGDTLELEFLYVPADFPVFLNPLASDTLCSNSPDYLYEVSIPGGSFFSSNIPNNQRKTGRYSFRRWQDKDIFNTDVIEYRLDNGCSIKDTVTIIAIHAGPDLISCLTTDSLLITNGYPVGGFWTGQNIDAEGLFKPTETGEFTLVYSLDWGCSDSMKIAIIDSILLSHPDTICSNQRITLGVNTIGGNWVGPGIIDKEKGILESWRPSANQWHTYLYELTGCSAETQLFIQGIPQGRKIVQCAQDSLFYPPEIGQWEGPGVFIDSLNAFNVSTLNEGTYDYTLTQGLCSSSFQLEIKNISFKEIANPFLCLEDKDLNISNYIVAEPTGGEFSGSGVSNTGSSFFINPMMSGSGELYIYYEVLGCMDSFLIAIDTPALIPSYSFCERSKPLLLEANPPGGVWSGEGFLNTATGLLDPQLLNFGFHEISYTAPNGCITKNILQKEILQPAEIGGILPFYCNNADSIFLMLSPPDGILKVNGVESIGLPNAAALGSGIHELEYSHGEGECRSSTRKFLTVLPPISPIALPKNDSICPNTLVRLEVLGEGGYGQLNYLWSEPLGFGNSHSIYPDSSQWYTFTLSDQCSSPYTDSVYIHVFPEILYSIVEGPAVCFGEESYVSIQINPPLPVDIIFNDEVYFSGELLYGNNKFHPINLIDITNGCNQLINVKFPGASFLRADFSIYPNVDCIDILNNQIEVINLSVGYDNLQIHFGEGNDWLYVEDDLQNITYQYNNPGDYTITLIAYNEIGCSDTIVKNICVENNVRLFIPNAFSPNGDGNNDELKLFALGIEDNMNWEIYDRWGNRVFSSDFILDTWDGNFKGKPANPGVYILVAKYFELETGTQRIISKDITLIR
jgi:gliding motility-associated-like protein